MMLRLRERWIRDKDFLLPACLFLLTVISRIPFTSKFLYHMDSVQFALALDQYDVTIHQPHPPGYFLYVMLGRLLRLFIHDANTVFVVISIFFSGLTVVAVYFLGKEMFDRKTAMGRRDYAILLILARLGLRAGEIKTLALEDLDWQEGLITVRGKAGRYSQMPLPADVGEAIADYLQHGRPIANSRCVFLRTRAPAGGFKGQCGIGSMVRHALARAGVDAARKGAHQFRHGLASQMLRQGASLSEIGELLRHRSPQTTAIYAKVDLASLATLALPWPGGAQ